MLFAIGLSGWLLVGYWWHDRALIVINSVGIFINITGILKFYMSGVYKPKDTNDQHIQGTVGKLFQLQSPSQVYLNLGLNYSLYSEKEEKELQLLLKGLYVGIGMAF